MHIANTLANGSERFDWMMSRRDGTELPMEVFLTRIQLGGRQLIQAVCGLVIVKRCVDLHGGKINVESKVGEGTAVTVRLPMSSKVSPPASASAGAYWVLKSACSDHRKSDSPSWPTHGYLRRFEPEQFLQTSF